MRQSIKMTVQYNMVFRKMYLNNNHTKIKVSQLEENP